MRLRIVLHAIADEAIATNKKVASTWEVLMRCLVRKVGLGVAQCLDFPRDEILLLAEMQCLACLACMWDPCTAVFRG